MKKFSLLLFISTIWILSSLPAQIFAGYTFEKCRFDPARIDFQDPLTYEKMSAVFKTWVINANTIGPIRVSRRGSNTIYQLSIKGLATRKFLHYERNRYGINIGWTSNASSSTERASRKWRIVRSTNSTGPLRYGEKVAIGWVRAKSFIRYKSRKWGINLVWSNTPSYEWIILGGRGVVRPRSNRVIFYNTKKRQPLVHVRRIRGGHIGWPSSKPYYPFYRGTIIYGNDKSCTDEHGVIATRVLAGDRDPSRK